MDKLKLVALDAEDLAVISAHLQDAVLRIGDMVWLAREQRFAAVANRFDWAKALRDGTGPYERRRTGLRFERVLSVKVRNLSLNAKNRVLELLAIRFEETDAPAGYITLIFAGGGAIRLEVECIEAEMCDLGAAWRAKRMPDHGLDLEEGEPGGKVATPGDGNA